jgi:hypothetical protein
VRRNQPGRMLQTEAAARAKALGGEVLVASLRDQKLGAGAW